MEPIAIRTDVTADDLQAIVDFHCRVYAAERGWNESFEAHVAVSLSAAAAGLLPRSRIWLAEKNEQLLGCIGMIEISPRAAQLRWFLVAPDARGHGLGKRLLAEALAFARHQGFASVFLWTEQSLTTAARLYENAGFRKTDAKPGSPWGANVVEERYELRIE